MKRFKVSLLLMFLVMVELLYGQAGALDMSFTSKINSYIYSTALQPDGKIIIGGEFKFYDYTISRDRIARLNSDASLDSTFNPGSGANYAVQAVALQVDGKILIGGDFTTYNGIACNRLARLNTDGSLDTTFKVGKGTESFTGNENHIYSIRLQNDAKIIICGRFESYNGVNRGGIARLNSDGTIDETFNPGTGVDYSDYIQSVVLQKDGKILIGGSFTTYNGYKRGKIARLNVDGSLDLTFDSKYGGVNGIGTSVRSISIQADDKIIIGGIFNQYNGLNRRNIARLKADGSMDSTFNLNNTLAGSIRATNIQSDGKILIGGYFDAYGGPNKKIIARLNTDGNLDHTFSPEAGFSDDIVSSIVIEPSGSILVAGLFTIIGGVNRSFIARIFGNSVVTNINQFENKTINIFPNPTLGEVIIKTANEIPICINVIDIAGRIVLNYKPTNTTSAINLENFSEGIYFVRVNTEQSIEVIKIVLEK